MELLPLLQEVEYEEDVDLGLTQGAALFVNRRNGETLAGMRYLLLSEGGGGGLVMRGSGTFASTGQ